MMGYGLFFWMPSFLVRSFALTLVQASLAYGGLLLIGALSDALRVRAGVDSLRYAILAGTGFYVLAALLLLFAARHLNDDWER